MGMGTLGLYPVFQLLQWHAKEAAEDAIKANIPLKDLQVFINADQNESITWEEAGEEFHYQGGMYDVVKTARKDGKTIYYCYRDDKEATVFAGMENLASNQPGNMSGNPVQKYLSHLLSQAFMPVDRQYLLFNDPLVNGVCCRYCIHPYHNVYRKIISPPPDLS